MTDAHDNTPSRRKPPTSGGRPPGAKSVRVKAARMVDKSLDVLDRVQLDEEAPYMARVVAAQTILTLAGMPVPGKAGRE